MWKTIKEIWYRLKVRKFTKLIQEGTRKRKILRDQQSLDTKDCERYILKLKETIEGDK